MVLPCGDLNSSIYPLLSWEPKKSSQETSEELYTGLMGLKIGFAIVHKMWTLVSKTSYHSSSVAQLGKVFAAVLSEDLGHRKRNIFLPYDCTSLSSSTKTIRKYSNILIHNINNNLNKWDISFHNYISFVIKSNGDNSKYLSIEFSIYCGLCSFFVGILHLVLMEIHEVDNASVSI